MHVEAWGLNHPLYLPYVMHGRPPMARRIPIGKYTLGGVRTVRFVTLGEVRNISVLCGAARG